MRFFALLAVVLAVAFASLADANKKENSLEAIKKTVRQFAKKAKKISANPEIEHVATKKVNEQLRKNEKKSSFQTRKPVKNYIEVESNGGNAARTKTAVAPTGAMFATAMFHNDDCDATPMFIHAVAANECIPDGDSSESHMYMMKSNRKAGTVSYNDLTLTYNDGVCVDADSANVEGGSAESMDTCFSMGETNPPGQHAMMTLLPRDAVASFRPDAGVSGVVMGTFQNTKSCINMKVNDWVVASYMEAGTCLEDEEAGNYIRFVCNNEGQPILIYYTDAACNAIDANNAAITFTSADIQDTCSAEEGFFRFDCISGDAR